MIISERIEPQEQGGWVLIRNYSDSGLMIRQDETGDLYEEAIDPEFTNRTYTETDIPIEGDGGYDEIEDKAIAFDILMGDDE